jgi:hypothetical protein
MGSQTQWEGGLAEAEGRFKTPARFWGNFDRSKNKLFVVFIPKVIQGLTEANGRQSLKKKIFC